MLDYELSRQKVPVSSDFHDSMDNMYSMSSQIQIHCDSLANLKLIKIKNVIYQKYLEQFHGEGT